MSRHIPAAMIMSNLIFTTQHVQRFYDLCERLCEIGGADMADYSETSRFIFSYSKACDTPRKPNCVEWGFLWPRDKKWKLTTCTWCDMLSKSKSISSINSSYSLPPHSLCASLFSTAPFSPPFVFSSFVSHISPLLLPPRSLSLPPH